METKLRHIKASSDMDGCEGLDSEFLNMEITAGEVEASLQKLKPGTAPGPDYVFTDLLIAAGEELKQAVLSLFSKSWEEGKVPLQWKTALVKFLKKAGKKSYHTAGAYRPISLTSCLGKCMERIITQRLYSVVEHNKLLDKEQDGFRMFRGTTHALLRLVQDIYNGFNCKKQAIAAFVDIEKAYDGVWRDGLMVKLSQMGITGKVWRWIDDFMNDRTACCTLGGQIGGIFDTRIGLPQGSVISPLLFNLFIHDIYKDVDNKKN